MARKLRLSFSKGVASLRMSFMVQKKRSTMLRILQRPASWGMGSLALFNSGEVRSENLAPFPKWTGVLERYFEEKKLGNGDCTASDFNRCHLNEWQAFLDGLDGHGIEARSG